MLPSSQISQPLRCLILQQDSLADFMALKRDYQKEIRQEFPDWEEFTDPHLRRAFEYYRIDGPNNATGAIYKVCIQIFGGQGT
jgi:hypothetical protein